MQVVRPGVHGKTGGRAVTASRDPVKSSDRRKDNITLRGRKWLLTPDLEIVTKYPVFVGLRELIATEQPSDERGYHTARH